MKEFKLISQGEYKFTYKKTNFILKEGSVGVYGQGKIYRLYQLDGVQKTFIRAIGWTKKDNYGGEQKKECVLNGIVTAEECQRAALNYVKELLG